MNEDNVSSRAVAVNVAWALVAGAGLVALIWLLTRPLPLPDGGWRYGLLPADVLSVWRGVAGYGHLLRPYLYYAHWPALLCTAWMLLSAFCLGRGLLERIRQALMLEESVPGYSGLMRATCETAIGYWAQSTVLFFLFAMRGGSIVLAGGVVALLAAPLLLGERYIVEAYGELRGWWRTWRRESRWGRIGWGDLALLVAIAMALLYSAILALAPPHQTDALRYHLTVPDLWLREGGFTYLPRVAFSNFPFMIEMLFAAPLALPYADALGLESVPRLIHWTWYLLLCGTVHAVAARAGGPRAGRVACALVATIPYLPALASWAFVEVALAGSVLLVFACLYHWRNGEDARQRLWWLVLTGAFGGVALCIKYTSVVVVGWLCLVVLIAGRRREPATRMASACFVGVVAVVMVLPWWGKSWMYTGNPVYPLANEIFDGPDWSPREASLYFNHARLKGELWKVPYWNATERAQDLVMLPYRLTVRPSDFGRWPVGIAWLGLLPFALVCTGRTRLNTFRVGALVLFLVWAYTYRDNRFLLPCLALLSIPLGVGLAWFFNGRPLAGALAGVLLGVAIATNVVALNGQFLDDRALRAATGAVSRTEFLSDPFIADYYTAFMQLPKLREELDERLLIVGQELAYYCPVPYSYADFFNTPLLVDLCKECETQAQVRDRLKQQGISHLFVNHGRLDPSGGYRALYDLHFLPDAQPVSPTQYYVYTHGSPTYDPLRERLNGSRARMLHDRFLRNAALLETRFRMGEFAVYRLR